MPNSRSWPTCLAKWLFSLSALTSTAHVTLPLSAQMERPLDTSGDWIAVFGDSASAGTLALHLSQDANGHVTGNYATTLGGVGIAAGQIDGNQLALTLAQTQAQCPGAYRGSVTFSDGAGDGSFSGNDCLGAHDNGVVSLHRKGGVAAPPASVPHDSDGNVQPYTLNYENGQAFWLSHSDSAFLAVAGNTAGDYFRLTVLVGNSSEEPVTFFPEAIQVSDQNSGKVLPYTSPEKIVQRIERRVAIASALMAFGSGLQAYSNSMVTIHTTGQLSMYDHQGDWAQGSYFGTSSVRLPLDTARLQAQNAQNNAMIAQSMNRGVAALTRSAMRSQTLGPKTYMVGKVFFPRPKVANVKALTGMDYKSYFVKVIVPVGNENFVFLFPVEVSQAMPHK